VNCHKGAEFTGASTRMVLGSQSDGFAGDGPIENMLMGDQTSAIYDNGFYNIGVTPAAQDVGIGGTDPWGNPLSFSRSYKNLLQGIFAFDSYTHSLDPCVWQVVGGCTAVRSPDMRDAVDGSFKTPTLRNVELTGPYFHSGSYGTLEQVVEFYNRGGNMRRTAGGDTTGFGSNHSNFDSEVMPIGLSAQEKSALVAFLKSLTDDRVRYEKAPFDHPSLKVPNGHKGDNTTVQTTDGVKANDDLLVLPAVGAAGLTAPIKPFLQ
jgi:cytochrome c peroxidase